MGFLRLIGFFYASSDDWQHTKDTIELLLLRGARIWRAEMVDLILQNRELDLVSTSVRRAAATKVFMPRLISVRCPRRE